MPTSSRILSLREFRGAYISKDGILLADFPGHDPVPRSIARVTLAQRQFSEAMKPTLKQPTQEGPYLVSIRSSNGGSDSEKDKQAPSDPDDSG